MRWTRQGGSIRAKPILHSRDEAISLHHVLGRNTDCHPACAGFKQEVTHAYVPSSQVEETALGRQADAATLASTDYSHTGHTGVNHQVPALQEPRELLRKFCVTVSEAHVELKEPLACPPRFSMVKRTSSDLEAGSYCSAAVFAAVPRL